LIFPEKPVEPKNHLQKQQVVFRWAYSLYARTSSGISSSGNSFTTASVPAAIAVS
jgi:hypothetical protein